jgi:hypothetical protein
LSAGGAGGVLVCTDHGAVEEVRPPVELPGQIGLALQLP